MKKSLIALAALATVATAAQAQSSVTIYGVMDMGVTTVDKATAASTRVTGLTSGGLSTPRFGFKGAEDLGGGLKASFGLESEIIADTGTSAIGSDSGYLFNRESTVGLMQNGVGAIKLGRMNHQDYNMAAKYDVFGGNNIGGWIASQSSGSSVTLDVSKRNDNAVQLQTASFGGLVFTYQHGFGEVAGNNAASRELSYGFEYTSGPFSIAYTQAKINSSAAVTTERNSLYAMYDFKVADLRLGYADKQTDGSSHKSKGYFMGVKVPVTKQVGLMAQYNSFDNDQGKKPTTFALGATYAFSKRTTGYIIGAKSSQDNSSEQQIVSDTKYQGFQDVAAGVDQTALSVGIRHTF